MEKLCLQLDEFVCVNQHQITPSQLFGRDASAFFGRFVNVIFMDDFLINSS